MENIHRAMQQAQLPNQLCFLPHLYNFVPFLLPLTRRSSWADHAALVHTGSRAGFALKSPGRPLVVTVHHLVADPTYRPYTRPAQRLFHQLERIYDGRSINRADAVTCVSDYTRQRVKQIYGRSDARVIHNGIDTRLFCPIPEEQPSSDRPFRLLFVGNRTKRKGADLLRPIMDLLGKDYELWYTGGQRPDEETMQFPGAVALGRLSPQELVQAYNACHALLFPSRLEGFGLAVAEAMACGLPVITSDCSSLPELVVQQQGGFLCAVDDVEAFASAARQLAQNPVLRQEMGAFNRARAQRNFSFPVMAERYRVLYAELGGTDGG
jgi:glycosyltransferase involved in cell wall biosynthesis